MADSQREVVIKAVVAALEQPGPINGITRPPNLAIHRMRDRPIATDNLPAVVVFLDDREQGERVSYEVSQKATRTLRFVFQCRELAAGGLSADEKLDQVTAWVVAAVMEDDTFGQITRQALEISTRWDSRETDTGVLSAANIAFDVTYDTALRTLTAP